MSKVKVDFAKLDRAFNPRCVAVIGDSGNNDFRWLRAQSTFTGKLYSVQVNPKTVEGIKALGVENYTSLLDIPEAVDLAIVAVPRAVAHRVLQDCIRKEVAAAHFFTAGFNETNSEEGRELERRLTETAEQANFHLIGPNCMGIFNPRLGLRQNEGQYTGFAGPVGFISQSGNHAMNFSLLGHLQGVDINKSVSFGNGVVLDSADFLEYFSRDPEIKIIGMYLEGVKDGRRFFRVLREVSARKPVIILKGGRTGGGERAIASHTGSLAVPQAIWEAAMRQCGAISVANMDELVDTVKALLHLAPVRSKRVGIIGGSGGQSVAVADAFGEAGLELPPLTRQSYDELATFWTLIGGGYPNPIDTGNDNRKEIKRILEILERDTNIDNLVLLILLMPGNAANTAQLENSINLMVDMRKKTLKPLMAITTFFTNEDMQQARDVTQKLEGGGVPTFHTIERGARALRNALRYYRFRGTVEGV
ncbi:MAG: CoA-binding protein [Chloroflexi bacterium]|nr:CoA-binding protein [Chloroflexota bacterium]